MVKILPQFLIALKFVKAFLKYYLIDISPKIQILTFNWKSIILGIVAWYLEKRYIVSKIIIICLEYLKKDYCSSNCHQKWVQCLKRPQQQQPSPTTTSTTVLCQLSHFKTILLRQPPQISASTVGYTRSWVTIFIKVPRTLKK